MITLATGERVRVTVKSIKDGWEIFYDVTNVQVLFIQERVTVVAVPQEPVLFVEFAFTFNHQAYRVCETLGAVGHF